MSRIKPISLEHLGTQRPEPATPSADPVAATSRRQWLSWAAWAALVAFIAWQQFGGRIVPPKPDVDVDGLYVMVMTPSDLAGLSKEQKEFLASAKIADWVELKQGKYRSYPQSQNIDNEESVWREIRSQLAPPYLVGVLKNRRLTKMEAPQGIDAGIAALERVR